MRPGINRRAFIAGGLATYGALAEAKASPISRRRGPVVREELLKGETPLIVSTWPFGKPANERAFETLTGGQGGLDAIEHGIRVTEADPGNSSVGLGGIPNAEGVVQLDACIMSGPGHRAGSVAAVEGFRHPISIARRVMEVTPHVMMVGQGAMMFADAHGFEKGPKVSPGQERAWRRWKARQAEAVKKADAKEGATEASVADTPALNHDTIAMILLMPNGDVFGGCSTSGWGYKLAGRVGDSPLIGGGLYVDNEVGAAGATGLGENVLRYCGSFLVVEFMRQGMHPQEACAATIHRIARLDPKGYDLSINFIALDKKGRFGAAGTGSGFQYAVTYPGKSEVLQSPGLTDVDVGPLGGNRK